jgi:hypothetical protein
MNIDENILKDTKAEVVYKNGIVIHWGLVLSQLIGEDVRAT